MTTEEKKIEESAKATYPNMYENSAFIVGAKSDAAKEYHTKGMYSEEEVQVLCNEAYNLGVSSLRSEIPDLEEMMEFDNWFNENKKK